ncbi:uncharacterized protein RAG0_06363 [Rhynchosporium agropyri]|uniref:Uncharacterized protein n=1 Tax=Rhynchosporium agropyri TaxID=914238 RepID=A0A1E1KGV1_9HELO|nr:uncharacterized protein RAG0_06363 [Rhynchosporium agropyri]
MIDRKKGEKEQGVLYTGSISAPFPPEYGAVDVRVGSGLGWEVYLAQWRGRVKFNLGKTIEVNVPEEQTESPHPASYGDCTLSEN